MPEQKMSWANPSKHNCKLVHERYRADKEKLIQAMLSIENEDIHRIGTLFPFKNFVFIECLFAKDVLSVSFCNEQTNIARPNRKHMTNDSPDNAFWSDKHSKIRS